MGFCKLLLLCIHYADTIIITYLIRKWSLDRCGIWYDIFTNWVNSFNICLNLEIKKTEVFIKNACLKIKLI